MQLIIKPVETPKKTIMKNYLIVFIVLFATCLSSTRSSAFHDQFRNQIQDNISQGSTLLEEHIMFINNFTNIRTQNGKKVDDGNDHRLTPCINAVCSYSVRSRRNADDPGIGDDDIQQNEPVDHLDLDPGGKPKKYETFIKLAENGMKVVDTETFLVQLENAERIQDLPRQSELVRRARNIQNEQNLPLTGEYKAVFKEVLNAGSLTELYVEKSTETMKSGHVELVEQNKYSSTSHNIGMIISLIPLIESGMTVVETCKANISSSECVTNGIMLGVSGLLFAAPIVIPKFLDWSICYKINAEIAKLPAFSARANGLRSVLEKRLVTISKLTTGIFTVVALGLEGYTMYQIGSKLAECEKTGNCTTGTIVGLSFSIGFAIARIALIIVSLCITLNPIVGALIAIALWLAEKFVYAIIAAVEFSKKFKLTILESITVTFSPNGEFATGLKSVKILVDAANKVIETQFKISPEVVAVAYALGDINLDKNNKIKRAYTVIDMENVGGYGKHPYLRVQPDPLPNTVPLCLLGDEDYSVGGDGTRDDELFETAPFYCSKAVVIGRKGFWFTPDGYRIHSRYPPPKKDGSSNGQILYLLQNTDKGYVIGNNFYHNTFVIFNYYSRIKSGASSNLYIIKELELLFCKFTFHPEAEYDELSIVDIAERHPVSELESNGIVFSIELHLNGRTVMGIYKTSRSWVGTNDINWKLSLKSPKDLGRQRLKVFRGLPNYPVSIQCATDYMLDVLKHNYTLVAIMGGGASNERRDYILNCHVAQLFPFSNYEYTYNGIDYLIYIQLDGTVFDENTEFNKVDVWGRSAINLRNNAKITLTLSGGYYIEYMVSIAFSREQNLLIWKMAWSAPPVYYGYFELYIYGYYRKMTDEEKARIVSPNNDWELVAVDIIENHALGKMRYSFEMPPSNETDTDGFFDIKVVRMSGKMDGTTLDDAMSIHRNVMNMRFPNFHVSLTIASEATKELFHFGSDSADKFHFDENVTYASGGGGKDIYLLYSTSPEYIWIDNYATDSEIDHLIIPDGLCYKVIAERYTERLSVWGKSENDVVVKCFSKVTSPRNVIFKDYLVGSANRHVLVFYAKGTFAILLGRPTQSKIEAYLTEYISLKEKSITTNVDSESHLTLLHVFDKSQPFDAYIEGKNVLLTQTGDVSGRVRLIDVYNSSNHRSDMNPKWKDNVFIVVEDNAVGVHMDWAYIENLLTKTSITQKKIMDARRTARYLFPNASNLQIIHNSAERHESLEIPAILEVRHIEPINLQAEWDNNHLELRICAPNSCVVIENWCRAPRYRLYSIEFNPGFRGDTITIPKLARLECEYPYSNDQGKLISILNKYFQHAQKLIESSRNSASDIEIFKRCMLTLYAPFATSNSIEGLFGFINYYHRSAYVQNSCTKAFKIDLFENLTQSAMAVMFKENLRKYGLFHNIHFADMEFREMDLKTVEKREAIGFIQESFNNPKVWLAFKEFMLQTYAPSLSGMTRL